MTDEEKEAIVGDGLLTVAEACAFLRLSRSWMYASMEAGRISYVRFAEDSRRAARRIPRRALVEFAARHLRGVAEQTREGP